MNTPNYLQAQYDIIDELMKGINGLRPLKEENVKLIECIKNLREQHNFLYQENVRLMDRINEIDSDVNRDLQDQLFTLKNDYAVLKAKYESLKKDKPVDVWDTLPNDWQDKLKAQKHPMYPLHWMGLDPLIHEQAKDLIIEEAVDKVKQKTPWVEEPIDWKDEKSWEEAASDLALRVTQLEEQLKHTQKIIYKDK
jgi:hypothetical protein